MSRSQLESFQRFPLTIVLGTESNVRLLRALTLHGGHLSAPSLTLQTGLAHLSVLTGLNTLVTAGVVQRIGGGRAKLYRLDGRHPLNPALEALFETERGRFRAVLGSIRDAAQACIPKPLAAYIYGSVANGQDTMASDLDILIVAASGSDVSALADAMRDNLRQSAKTIGFTPSVAGIERDEIARHLRSPASPWRSTLESVTVAYGKAPADLLPVPATP